MATENNNENLYVEERDEQQLFNSLKSQTPTIQASNPLPSGNSFGNYIDTKPKNKYGIRLTQEEQQARTSGANDAALGVYHSNYEDMVQMRKGTRAKAQEEGTTSITPGTDYLKDEYAMTTSGLYNNMLGRTAYEDLKYKCGLEKDASFTDYYNKTKYVPKGYEMEARLLLAEEKRMKQYQRYQDGEISETDFLWEAYGKDLLKEEGVDFSSQLYWYNRYQKGDYSNPLDSDTFLETVINNARQLFQAEEWFRESQTRNIGSTLAGVVVGTQLSDEKVYELFKDQIDALKPYFDDDVKKVITYYQAGSLGAAFTPFLDVDGDGKYDYYYHLNNKLYAVEGSSGSGDKTCKIEYNDDGTVHKVEINEGLKGAAGGFFEGLGGFAKTFIDLGGMLWAATFGSIGKDQYFVDSYQEYNAGMQKAFSDQDVVTFDEKKDYGYEIARGVGSVTGQVILNIVLAVLTWGAANTGVAAGQAAAKGAATAAKVAGKAAIEALRNAAIGMVAGAAIGAGVGAATGKDDVAGSAITGAGIGGALGAAIGVSGAITMAQQEAAAAAEAARAAGAVTKTLSKAATITKKGMAGIAKFVGFITKANSGAVFSGATIGGRFANASILALKDLIYTSANLAATNRVLEYYENEVPDSGIHALSIGEIIGRGLITAGVDLAISTSMRLMGSHGLSSFTKSVKAKMGKEVNIFGQDASKVYSTLSSGNKELITSMGKNMATILNREVRVDNVFDIVENIITMSTSAAMQNPYAKIGSKESFETFGKAAIAPQAIIQNLYITARNIHDFRYGSSSTRTQRTQELLLSKLPVAETKVRTLLTSLAASTDDIQLKETLSLVLKKFNDTIAGQKSQVAKTEASQEATQTENKNYFDNVLTALNELDGLLDKETLAQFLKDSKTLSLVSDATGLSKKRIQEIANSSEVKGLATALVLNEAKDENVKFIVTAMQDMYNDIKTVTQMEDKVYKDIFLGGVKSFFRPNESIYKKTFENFKDMVSNYLSAQELQSYLRAIDSSIIMQEPIMSREAQAMQTISADKLNTFYKINTFSTKTPVGESDIKVELDNETGEIRQTVSYKDGSNDMLEVMSSVEARTKLIQNGIAIETEDENGKKSFVINDKTPYLVIQKNTNKNNEALRDDEVIAYDMALEALDKLSNATNNSGERLINSETPLCTKVEIKTKNSSGGESVKTLYIIASPPEATSFSGVQRLQYANKVLSALYTINFWANYAGNLEASNALSQAQWTKAKSGMDAAIKMLGLVQYPNLVDDGTINLLLGDIPEGETKFETALKRISSGDFKFEDLSEDTQTTLRRLGIVSLLEMAPDMKQTGLKKGITRKFVFGLMSLNDEWSIFYKSDIEGLLKYDDAHPQSGILTEKVRDNLDALKQYAEIMEPLKKVSLMLNEYNENARVGKQTKLTPSKVAELEDLLLKLHSKDFEWLKPALEEDGKVTSDILLKLFKDPKAELPFLKGLEDLATSLAPSTSVADFLSEEDKRRFDDWVQGLFDNYNYIEQQNNILPRTSKLFWKRLDSIKPDYKTSLDNYLNTLKDASDKKVIGSGKFLLEELKALLPTLRVKTQDSKEKTIVDKTTGTAVSTSQPYTIYISSDTDIAIRSIIKNLEYSVNTKDIKETKVLFTKMQALIKKASDSLPDLLLTRNLWEEGATIKAWKSEIADELNTLTHKTIYDSDTNILEMYSIYMAHRDEIDATLDWVRNLKGLRKDYVELSAPITDANTIIHQLGDLYIKSAEQSLSEQTQQGSDFKTARENFLNTRAQLDAINCLKYLKQEEVSDFLVSPIAFIKGKLLDATIQNNTRDIEAWSLLLKKGLPIIDGTGSEDFLRLSNKESLALFILQSIDPEACTDLDTFRQALESETGHEKLKDYINATIYSENNTGKDTVNLDTNFEFTYTSKGTPIYKGKSVLNIVLDNVPQLARFTSFVPEEYKTTLAYSINKYNQFLTEDTTKYTAREIIEVNVLDLLPQKMQQVIRLMAQSQDYKKNIEQETQLQDVQNELQSILKSMGATKRFAGSIAFDSQLNSWIELLKTCEANKSYLFRVNINDVESMKSLEQTLLWLGYDKSTFIKLTSGEPAVIPGVRYRQAVNTGIALKGFDGIAANDFFVKYNSKMTAIETASITEDRANTGFFMVLENAFGSSHYLTEDSDIDIKKNGSPMLFAIPFLSDKSVIKSDFISELLINNFTKLGTIAGQGSKVNRIINKAKFFTGTEDSRARNTYTVLRIAQLAKNYLAQAAKGQYIVIDFDTEEMAKSYYDSAKSMQDSVYTLSNHKGKQVSLSLKSAEAVDTLLSKATSTKDVLRALLPIPTTIQPKDNQGHDNYTYSNNQVQTYINSILKSTVGITTLDGLFDLLTLGDDSFYNLDKSIYSSFANGISKVKEITRATLTEEQANNFYIQSLRHLVSGTLELNSIDETDDYKLLYNSHIRALLAEKLDTSTERDANKLASEIIKDYKKEAIKAEFLQDSDIIFEELVSSGSAQWLRTFENAQTIDEATLAKEIKSFLDNYEANSKVYSLGTKDFIKHNSDVTSLGIFDVSEDGQLYISIERLTSLTKKDRESAIRLLKEVAKEYGGETSASGKAILDAVNTLTSKFDILKDLDAISDNEDIISEVRLETAWAAQPIAKQGTNPVFVSNDPEYSDKFKVFLELANNRFLAKGAYRKFIQSSSMYDANTDFSPALKFYTDLINRNIYSLVDKQGHTLVYNLNSREAFGAMFNSIITCANAMSDNELIQNAGIKQEELWKLALHLNAYSTGVTHDAERTGAVIVTIDKNGLIDIKPIVTSSTNEERSLLKELHWSDINYDSIEKDTEHKHLLIRVNKNSFIRNVSGMSSGILLYDLDNESVRNDLKTIEYNNILDWVRIERNDLYDAQLADVYREYYSNPYYDMPTYSELRQNLVDILVNYGGVSQVVAEEAIATVTALKVQNPTSWSEQAVNDILAQLHINKDTIPNEQIKRLDDIFLFGITRASLSDETLTDLRNYKELLYKERMSEAAKDILSITDENERLKAIQALTPEEAKYLGKYIMVSRLEGADLEYILSGDMSVDSIIKRHDIEHSSHRDELPIRVFDEATGKYKTENWQYKVYDPKTKQMVLSEDKDINAFNVWEKVNSMDQDSEWGIRKNGKLDPNTTYQIAFIVNTDGYTKHQKYNIYIRNNILSEDEMPVFKYAGQNNEKVLDESGTYYIEDIEQYNAKVKFLRDHKTSPKEFTENGITYYIADNIEDAAAYQESIIDKYDIKVMSGYNTDGQESDNDRLAQTEAGKRILSKVNILDVRTIGSGVESSSYDSKLQKKDNLQLLIQKYKLDSGESREAHDALSDIEATQKLREFYINSRQDVTNSYNRVYDEMFKLFGITNEDGTKDDSLVRKILDFSELRKQNLTLKDGSKYKYYSLTRTNGAIKAFLNAEGVILESSENRMAKKASRYAIESMLYGNDSFYKAQYKIDYFNHARNIQNREKVATIFSNLILSRFSEGKDFSVLDASDVAKAYHIQGAEFSENKNKVNGILTTAAKNYFKPVIEKELGRSVDNNELAMRFMSLDADNMLKYINKALGKKEDDKILLEGSDRLFAMNDKSTRDKSFLETLASDSVFNLEGTEKNRLQNEFSRILDDIFPSITTKMEDYKGNEEFFDIVYDNLLRYIGNPEGTLAQEIEHKRRNVKLLMDKRFESVANYLLNSLNTDESFYVSPKTLFRMPTEGDGIDDSVPEAVVKLGAKLIDKAFPSLKKSGLIIKDGDTSYFYAQVSRQPGYGTTEILKVIVDYDNPNKFAMSTTTQQTYFNGDFDSDHNYIKAPDKITNAYGEAMFNKTTAGIGLINLFKDKTLQKISPTKILEIHPRTLERLNEQAVKVYQGELSVEKFNETVMKLTSNEEDKKVLLAMYGFEVIPNRSLSNTKQSGNILVTRNHSLLEYARSKGLTGVVEKMISANRERTFSNHYGNVIESQELGTIAKAIKSNIKTDLSKALFSADVALTDDNIKQLSLVLASIPEQERQTMIINYINKLDDITDKSELINFANKKDFNVVDLVTLSQAIQYLESNSEAYIAAMDKTAADTIAESSAQKVEDINAMKELFTEAGILPADIVATDFNQLSLPARANMAARMVQAWTRYTLGDDLKVRSETNSVVRGLVNTLITKGNIDITNARGMQIISPDNMHLNINGVDGDMSCSMAKAKFIVVSGGVGTDTARVTDACKLYVHDIASIDLRNHGGVNEDGTPLVWDKLNAYNGKELTGSDINKLIGLKENAALDNYTKYIIKTDEKNKRFVNVINTINYKDAVTGGQIKMAQAESKALKFTVNDTIMSSKGFDGTVPDFVIPESLFTRDKMSMFADAYKTGETVKYNGKLYEVIEIDGLNLMEAWHINNVSSKDITIDRVTVMNSMNNTASFLNYGNLCVSFDENGHAMFDNSGFNALQSALDAMGKYDAYSVNAADEINAIRIASLMLGLDAKQQKVFAERNGYLTTKDFLLGVYDAKDIGGKYGDSLISALEKLYRNNSEKLDEIKSGKNNPLYATAWQSTIDESRPHLYSSSEIDEDSLISKKSGYSNKNLKRNQAKITSNLDTELIKSANGRKDNTSFYYDRLQFLEDLYRATSKDEKGNYQNRRISRYDMTQYARLSDRPDDFVERVFPGTQANNGHSISNRSSSYIGEFTDAGYSKKAGNTGEAGEYIYNYEGMDVTGILQKSIGSEKHDNRKLIDTYYKRKSNGQALWRSTLDGEIHKALMAMMTPKGTDAEMAEFMDNRSTLIDSQNYETTVAVNPTTGRIETYSKLNSGKGELPTEYSQRINDVFGSAKKAQLFQEKIQSVNYRIQNDESITSRIEKISTLLDSPEYSIGAKAQQILDEYVEQGKFDEIRNEMDYNPFKTFLNIRCTEEAINKAYELGLTDNGIEVVRNMFSSAGFRSKDGKSINLEQAVLYLNNVVKQNQDAILGDDFKTIVCMINEDPSISNVINDYMQAYDLVFKYTTIIENKNKLLRDMSLKEYNELVEIAKKDIMGIGKGNDFETSFKQLQANLDSITNNTEYKKLFDIIVPLNLRILEKQSQYNPYESIGFNMPFYLDTCGRKKGRSLAHTYVTAFNIKQNKTKDILNGYMKDGKGNVRIATSMFDSGEGYIGTITRMAQHYATIDALRSLNSMLREKGYMKNIEVFTLSHALLDNEIKTRFKDSFNNIILRAENKDYDAETYKIMRKVVLDAVSTNSIMFPDTLTSADDFMKLHETIEAENAKMFQSLTNTLGREVSSRQDLEELYQESLAPGSATAANKASLAAALKINDAYQNTTANMLAVLADHNGMDAADILHKIYNEVMSKYDKTKYTLVDARGVSIEDASVTPTALRFSMADLIMHVKLNDGDREANIAKMMLTGDIYLMRKSVADQLMKNVYTQRLPGIVLDTVNKISGYWKGFVMATPLDLPARKMNFTMFDIGALMSADAKALKYLGDSISTIERYAMNPDNITIEALNTDKNLQLLLRYMAATGQSPIETRVYEGESFNITNLPILKQWMQFAAKSLAKQQFYVRLAYFMDLVQDGEKNNLNLDARKFGVAYHLKGGLSDMEAMNKNAFVYRNLYDFDNGDMYSKASPETLQRMMNMDAAAVQVVAENVGIFGNMPAAARWLSNRLGMVFVGFPLQGLRWGYNRIQSLAYAFTDFESPESRSYLLRNTGSTLLTMALLTALQVLLSQDTMDYLKKRIKGKSKEEATEELGEDAMQNVENILFRGGCVKVFDSILKGEEVTSANQSRGMLGHLWNTYLSDFILNKDEGFTTNLLNKFKQLVWGHQTPVVKDIVESIPGNKYLQTYNWMEPSDNFLENISRKALGYLIGNSQSTAFINSWKATANEEDMNFLERVGTGMQRAFVDNATGIHEYKSNFRNYKKAFSVIYKYTQMINPSTEEYATSETYTKVKSELMNALQNKSSASAIYRIVEDELDKGTPIGTVRSALLGCSIRSKLDNLGDLNQMNKYMTDQELAVIKSALMYEDYMFPYLTDIFEDIDEEYRKLRKNNQSYSKSIASILNTRRYNYESSSRNYNSTNYNNNKKYYNNMFNNTNKYNKRSNTPTDVLQQMRNNYKYASTTDLYGNQYKNSNQLDRTSYKQNPIIRED